MDYEIGERVVDRSFGLGTIYGRFLRERLRLYHVRLDVQAPDAYASGRRHVYRLGNQLRGDVALTKEEEELVRVFMKELPAEVSGMDQT